MAHKSTTIDLDAQLAEVEDEPVHTKTIKVFGREWTLVCDVNAFNMTGLMGGKPEAILGFFDDVIHPDQLADFKTTLAQQKKFGGEKLGVLLGAMVEAASERPTKQPSVSSRGATKRTSAPRSAAGSSQRAVRSVR